MSSDRVSAGEIRAMGFPVPDNVPDCATTARSKISWGTVDAIPPVLGAKHINVGISVTYGEPFKWVQVAVTVPTNKQQEES